MYWALAWYFGQLISIDGDGLMPWFVLDPFYWFPSFRSKEFMPPMQQQSQADRCIGVDQHMAKFPTSARYIHTIVIVVVVVGGGGGDVVDDDDVVVVGGVVDDDDVVVVVGVVDDDDVVVGGGGVVDDDVVGGVVVVDDDDVGGVVEYYTREHLESDVQYGRQNRSDILSTRIIGFVIG